MKVSGVLKRYFKIELFEYGFTSSGIWLKHIFAILQKVMPNLFGFRIYDKILRHGIALVKLQLAFLIVSFIGR